MVGVDLKEGVLMEIVVASGETCRKYNLGEKLQLYISLLRVEGYRV